MKGRVVLVLKLHFATSGNLSIVLTGLILVRVVKACLINQKSFRTSPEEIYLEARDMRSFTDWGIVELEIKAKAKEKKIDVLIDSRNWGWYGSAEIALVRGGQVITAENFQSGVRGPFGNPGRYRSYPVLESV